MSGRILLGVAASVAGSLGHSLGMTLQKRAHIRIEQLNSISSGCKRKAWKDGQWQLGLALYLFSSTVPPTVALSMLPVFVAAPLAAVGLVANAVFARCILASTFARTDALGTLLVTVGSCCVAAFGAIDEPLLSLRDLLLLYKRPTYVAFFSVYLALVAFLIAAELYWRRTYRLLETKGAASFCAGPEPPHSAQQQQQQQHHQQQQQQQLQNEQHCSSIALSAPRVPLRSISALRTAPPRGGHFSGETTPLLAPFGTAAAVPDNHHAAHAWPYASTTDTHPPPTSSHTSIAVAADHTQLPSSTGAVNDMYRRHFSSTNEALLANEAKMGQDRAAVARCTSGFLSAVISGLICSQTLLLAKSGIGLLVLTVKGDMQFKDPLALAIVAGLVFTALANLYYIQHALRLCSTLTVVPLCYCSSSLAALISSLVYFDQLRLLAPPQVTMISVGIILLAVGVGLLSAKAAGEDGPVHLLPPDEPLAD
ncbi:hypothetical protein GGI23_001666 [Coemansia sp. RSA 2559]|nr:hypothetical protein GGI23_001666 [Coemansia sp. RSA 2559]KAJ2864513.1 hypothetical protein GGI22_001700 [Coemansia erecta]